MSWCAAEEPDWIRICDHDLEDVATAISLVVNSPGVKTRSAHLAGSGKVTRNGRVDAAEEMELEHVAHVCGGGIGTE